MDELNDLTEQIVNEVLKETESVMWKMARTTYIPGFDCDDLMQEMRIKIWETIKNNGYDPERTRETSFYYRVCKNCLIDLNRSKLMNHKLKNAPYRDLLDQKCLESDEFLPKVGEFPTNFVKSFSESFKNLVLPDEEINDEKRRTD
jgi:DNA-directed RNA polymerase specialized sigma24 family protein